MGVGCLALEYLSSLGTTLTGVAQCAGVVVCNRVEGVQIDSCIPCFL